MFEKFSNQVYAFSISHSNVRYWMTNTLFVPELKQDDPLDLSILLSGGKEINKDFLSKGD
jgi:hypothetical protein